MQSVTQVKEKAWLFSSSSCWLTFLFLLFLFCNFLYFSVAVAIINCSCFAWSTNNLYPSLYVCLSFYLTRSSLWFFIQRPLYCPGSWLLTTGDSTALENHWHVVTQTQDNISTLELKVNMNVTRVGMHTHTPTCIYKYMTKSHTQRDCWHTCKAHKLGFLTCWCSHTLTLARRHMDTKQTCHPNSLPHTHPQSDLWHTHTHRNIFTKQFIVAAEYLSCLSALCHSILIPLVFTVCDKCTQQPVTKQLSQDSLGVVFLFVF